MIQVHLIPGNENKRCQFQSLICLKDFGGPTLHPKRCFLFLVSTSAVFIPGNERLWVGTDTSHCTCLNMKFKE